MFEVRTDEPASAFLRDTDNLELNKYGLAVDLLDRAGEKSGETAGQSLDINGDGAIGNNPNRNKQHGFHFTADNCIACHACEAACAEKNATPSHLAFRSVGYIEGGTYPAYSRLNISMACNHCDDPVCLKGCPTRAYTKFTEYGAVLQDPDICFGCGYCTWVCPYNAPQLDPIKGEVSKCNMCVDRLEVGLKPACVSACLAGALDFGVVENTPINREQTETRIPGFPDPSITHPNIRFQQTKSLPREMTRTDNMPIKYHRNEDGDYVSELHAKHGSARQWNWGKLLRSHESAHALFTLSTQAVLGALLLLLLAPLLGVQAIAALPQSAGWPWISGALVVLLSFGLFKLNMHLGKPHRFYRGFNNLRHSPVSREIAGVSLLFVGLTGYALFSNLPGLPGAAVLAQLAAWFAALGGVAGLWFMVKIYRIPARPFWDHWQTGTAFFGTTASLGALLLGLLGIATGAAPAPLLMVVLPVLLAGLLAEGIGHLAHRRYLISGSGEAAAAWYRQTTQYGWPFRLRNLLFIANLLLATGLLLMALAGAAAPLLLSVTGLLALSMLGTALISRSLFFVLVIPTTMPGAFFWRNEAFVEHARETGLAEMPQFGVAYQRHHAFKLGELLETIRTTSARQMLEHFKAAMAWR